MKTIKEEAIKLIDKLPDEVTWDDIMAELYFRQQVEQGMKDVAEGRVYSHDQVKKIVMEWRKSSGRLYQMRSDEISESLICLFYAKSNW